MKNFNRIQPKLYLFIVFIFFIFLSIFRVHVRVETTLMAYELGKLKSLETQLLQKKSILTMHLSKISSRDHLIKSIN